MFVVHATARLLAKLGPPAAGGTPPSTTSLGAWHATVLRWPSPVALFVNEATLLPVLLPLAPARSLCERFPGALAAVLAAHAAPTEFIETEIRAMDTCVLAKTANHSTVGMLTEFAFLADAHRDGAGAAGLTALAVRLAHTQCEVGLDGRYKWGGNRGMTAAGERLVLPGGRINTYAAEINGTPIVDGAVHLNRIVRRKVGGLRETSILVDIIDGVAENIECADSGLRERMHEWLADDNSRRVGELGFGTNTGVDRFTDWNSRINERAPSVHIGLGQHDQAPKLVGYWADIHLDLVMADGQLHIEDEPPFDLRNFADESVTHPESLSNADGAAAGASMPHVS